MSNRALYAWEETELGNRDQVSINSPKENAKTLLLVAFRVLCPRSRPVKLLWASSLRSQSHQANKDKRQHQDRECLLTIRIPRGAKFHLSKTLKLRINSYFLLTPRVSYFAHLGLGILTKTHKSQLLPFINNPTCHENKSSRLQHSSDSRAPYIITPGLWVTVSWYNKHESRTLWHRLQQSKHTVPDQLQFHLVTVSGARLASSPAMCNHLQFPSCIIRLENYHSAHQISRSSTFPSCTPAWSQWCSVVPSVFTKALFAPRYNLNWMASSSTAGALREECTMYSCNWGKEWILRICLSGSGGMDGLWDRWVNAVGAHRWQKWISRRIFTKYETWVSWTFRDIT